MKTGMTSFENDMLNSLQFSNLKEYNNISHFVATQLDADIIRAILNIAKVHVSKQVHGDGIAIVDNQTGTLHGFDALITGEPDVCIAVSTADCVPVLLFAPDKHIVAAVHAGWRGTVLGILSKTVHKMIEQFGCNAQLMKAGIAPSISMEAFETGDEVLASFLGAGENMSDTQICHRHPVSGKIHIDLKKINRRQLIASGLLEENIELSDICTYSQSDKFLSARRQGVDCGRMLTGIMMKF